MFDFDLVPGARIALTAHPEWGEGHVQSCIGGLLTANFEHAGKRVIKTSECNIEVLTELETSEA